MRCGAPDLPFLETLGWYAKQIAAVGIVLTVAFSALFLVAAIFNRGAK